MKNKKHIFLFIFAKYLIDLAPTYINYININKSEISVNIKSLNLIPMIYLLKNHNNFKFTQLIDLCGVDYIQKKKRFEVIYNLLSIKFNIRIRIKVQTTELEPLDSISNIFFSGN